MEKQQKKPGRPKTKEYRTLMARIPQDLVDRVQEYASQRRQNISALIRDALEVYINNADVLSYRYGNMSDTKENVSDTFEESTQPRITDTTRQELQEMVAAAVQAEIGKLQTFMEKASGVLTRAPAPEAPAPLAELSYDSNTVVQESARQTDIPPYDTSKYLLGKLCPQGHAWGTTGQSLLSVHGHTCKECKNAYKRRKRAEKHQEQPA